ncbi:MAG: hypothetical protein JW852_02950 [Spirochaetales bacterium]|nr:hypothetical protein [Spirochaetales bacterium]
MEKEEARQEIIGGIRSEAEAQAAGIIADARKAAEDQIKAAGRQAVRIKEEAEEKAAKQIAAIEREAATRLTAARRRMKLEMAERVYQHIISRCTEELEKLIGSGRYGKMLEDWIVQAAVGLRAESAVVNCSSAEHEAAAAVLPKAEERARSITGKQITLTFSDDRPLANQGVMITSADGRTAFNNQVQSRIFRMQTEIRKLVHDRLF